MADPKTEELQLEEVQSGAPEREQRRRRRPPDRGAHARAPRGQARLPAVEARRSARAQRRKRVGPPMTEHPSGPTASTRTSCRRGPRARRGDLRRPRGLGGKKADDSVPAARRRASGDQPPTDERGAAGPRRAATPGADVPGLGGPCRSGARRGDGRRSVVGGVVGLRPGRRDEAAAHVEDLPRLGVGDLAALEDEADDRRDGSGSSMSKPTPR